MIVKNRVSKIAGPSGVFAGYILFIFGIVSVYFTWTSLPVILIGGAMAFSYNATIIDFGSKRYRPLLYLFGFIPLGPWIDLEPSDQLSVKHFKGSYTSSSRSNRQSSVFFSDFRVIIDRDADRKKIQLARFKTEAEALELLRKIQVLLSND